MPENGGGGQVVLGRAFVGISFSLLVCSDSPLSNFYHITQICVFYVLESSRIRSLVPHHITNLCDKPAVELGVSLVSLKPV